MPHRIVLALIVAISLPGAETPSAVLARMDAQASSFRDMSAKLKKSHFTAVLNDTDTETGTLWMRRSGGREIQVRTDIATPDPKSARFHGGRAEVYYPKINTVQIFDLSKYGKLTDQFLTLGWSSSSKELLNNYSLKVGGEEDVAGQKTTRLELVPKSAKALEQIRKIELWIPLNTGHPVQQKLLQPGGDFYLFNFFEVRLNTNLSAASLDLNVPKDAKREYPQK